jgi:hypothetical protein
MIVINVHISEKYKDFAEIDDNLLLGAGIFKGKTPKYGRFAMKNKFFLRMIVCATLAIGLVLAGCETGTNGGGGNGTENTGNNNTGGKNNGVNTGNGINDDNNNTGGNTGGNGNNNGGNNDNTAGNDGNTGSNGNTGGNGGNDTDGNSGENDDGNSGSNTGGGTATKPGVPAGVKATALSSTKIQITWNAVSGATSYKIYSPNYPGSSSGFALLDTITTNSYTDNYPEAGETWYYKVSAVNSAGESAQSSSVSARTPSSGGSGGNTGGSGGNSGGGGTTTSKPNVPYGKPVIKAQTSDSLTLEWNASLRATGYKLYRSSSITPTFGVVYSGSQTTYKDTGLVSGITYKYKVTATNSAGESDYSDEIEYMK